MADEDYYLRDLVASDWSEFKKMEDEIFPEDSTREESYNIGLSSPKGLFVVMVHKESKEFIGYCRFLLYGTLGYIQRIGVRPKYQQKGYGAILMDSAMDNLEKAGATKFMLYVMQENEAAINLYKKYLFQIEYHSIQFEIPFKSLPKEPRGECRHIDWGEIQLLCLRFGLNPYRIQSYFGQENQHVLVYQRMGQQLGMCRFSPDFPGAFPFIIRDKDLALDFVAHLVTYITNKEFDAVKILIDQQQDLVDYMSDKKMPVRNRLYRMSRLANLE